MHLLQPLHTRFPSFGGVGVGVGAGVVNGCVLPVGTNANAINYTSGGNYYEQLKTS